MTTARSPGLAGGLVLLLALAACRGAGEATSTIGGPSESHIVTAIDAGLELGVGGPAKVLETPRFACGSLQAHDGAVTSLAFSDDGHLLASAGGRAAIMWRFDGGRSFKAEPIAAKADVSARAVALSAKSETVAIAWDDRIALLSTQTGSAHRPALAGETAGFTALAFTQGGRQLVAAGGDHIARWNVGDGTRAPSLPTTATMVSALAANSAGLVAVGERDGRLRVLDASDGSEKLGETAMGAVVSVDISPDGLLASGWTDQFVRVWRLSDRKQAWYTEAHPGAGPGLVVVFLTAGVLMASASDDNVIRFWDAATGRPSDPHAAVDSAVTSLAFSAPAARLAAGLANGRIRFYCFRAQP